MRHLTISMTIAALAVAMPVSAQDAATRTVKDSVYTAEQAERGEGLFGSVCAECHASSEFTDKSFITAWSTATVFEFYDNLKASMPENAPGSLLDDEYADAVSYILSLNGFPAGASKLSVVPDTLMGIMMAIPDSVGGAPRLPGSDLGPTPAIPLGSHRHLIRR